MTNDEIKLMLENRILTLTQQKALAFTAGDLKVYSDIELQINDSKITLAQMNQIPKQEE